MFITLYHGTNNNAKQVAQFPQATKAINGVGFYVTDDINVAKHYGCNVVSWEVRVDFPDQIGLIRQTIDQSWKDKINTYKDCAKNGFEYRLSQRQADELAVEAERVGFFDANRNWNEL